MGRSPCCEKLGLKRGPWSKEEDDLLITYINKNGHPNWRALPKLAGLLRCGKSCRLRWTNYLKPDIKRGNFTNEEEDTIIELHQLLGNRWSTIAARLPGRTDNEIKNIWHTRLKKKISKSQAQKTPELQEETSMETSKSDEQNLDTHLEPENSNFDIHLESDNSKDNSEISSPKTNSEIQQQSSSSVHSSSSSISSSCEDACSNTTATSPEPRDQFMLDNLVEIDDDFWSEVLWTTVDDSNYNDNNFDLSLMEDNYQINPSLNDNWFWDDLFTRSNELMLELSEF